MLYIIRYYIMHPFHGALPVPYVPLWVTRGACINILMRLFAAEPSCTVRLLFHSQCLYEAIVLTTYSIVWDAGFKSWANVFSSAYAARSVFIFYCCPFLFSLSLGWYCWAGVVGLIRCKLFWPCLASPASSNNNSNNNNNYYYCWRSGWPDLHVLSEYITCSR